MVKYWGGGNFIEKSVLVSVILAFSHKKKKMPLNKYYKNILSLCCLYINFKIECEIIAI